MTLLAWFGPQCRYQHLLASGSNSHRGHYSCLTSTARRSVHGSASDATDIGDDDASGSGSALICADWWSCRRGIFAGSLLAVQSSAGGTRVNVA